MAVGAEQVFKLTFLPPPHTFSPFNQNFTENLSPSYSSFYYSRLTETLMSKPNTFNNQHSASSMDANTVYLVTGVNRGIGHGMMNSLVQRPNTTVIGTVRGDPELVDTSNLDLAKGSLVIIKSLSSTSETDATTLITSLELSHNITSIDVIIANAGVAASFDSALKTPISELRVDFETNTLGPIKLFQAAYPLLQKSQRGPKFIYISSSLGSIEAKEESPILAYGVSKAAANFFVRTLHFEHEDLVAVALHPGWVKTGNGQAFADAVGVTEPPMTIEASVDGVLKQVDAATRETASGKFVSYDGTIIPW
ncbi:NAD(P)-binding protein-15 [Coleophoma cylindrospora]|uniref:NAD(P)-binding protein-15 n=1 Tax=Coleophoma cylindrospora TaxID=1849047 RepID=A0A3D8R600_9HELO|nr:NAD(P)-binding protein-15 [Coleophoma cylindrospora]